MINDVFIVNIRIYQSYKNDYQKQDGNQIPQANIEQKINTCGNASHYQKPPPT